MSATCKSETIRVGADVDAQLAKEARVFAAYNGMKMPALVTQALREFLDRNRENMPSLSAR